MFTLTIRTDNAAFEDREGEIARILRRVARELEGGEDFSCFRNLFDSNGNYAGRAAFEDE